MGIRQRLNLSRLYLCTDLRTEEGDFFDFVRAVFAGGVDLLQVRDKKAAPEQSRRRSPRCVAWRPCAAWWW